MSTELIVIGLHIQKKLDSQSIFLQQQNFKNRGFCKNEQPLPGHFFSCTRILKKGLKAQSSYCDAIVSCADK